MSELTVTLKTIHKNPRDACGFDGENSKDIIKTILLATLFTGFFVLTTAHAGTVYLLAIWGSDGVDADAADNGVADQLFCKGGAAKQDA
ncbi:hypothetical protein N9856_04580 [Porticoccaceae bacterium]|nr:hypothetical protein [Porticoccaceae bacterium]